MVAHDALHNHDVVFFPVLLNELLPLGQRASSHVHLRAFPFAHICLAMICLQIIISRAARDSGGRIAPIMAAVTIAARRGIPCWSSRSSVAFRRTSPKLPWTRAQFRATLNSAPAMASPAQLCSTFTIPVLELRAFGRHSRRRFPSYAGRPVTPDTPEGATGRPPCWAVAWRVSKETRTVQPSRTGVAGPVRATTTTHAREAEVSSGRPEGDAEAARAPVAGLPRLPSVAVLPGTAGRT
jgi:hypothetical protein